MASVRETHSLRLLRSVAFWNPSAGEGYKFLPQEFPFLQAVTIPRCLTHAFSPMPLQPGFAAAAISRVFLSAIRIGGPCLLALSLLTACTTTQAPRAQVDPLQAHIVVQDMSGVESMFDVAWRNAAASDADDAQALAIPDTRDLARAALTQLGVKYRYGGTTPNTGFDCSGLVVYAAEQSLGLKLPRRAADMARVGVAVKRAELQVGDLVFFNTRGRRFSHMGIYLGDQQFVHAPRTGAVVRVERMDKAYWQTRYNGARRLDTST